MSEGLLIINSIEQGIQSPCYCIGTECAFYVHFVIFSANYYTTVSMRL